MKFRLTSLMVAGRSMKRGPAATRTRIVSRDGFCRFLLEARHSKPEAAALEVDARYRISSVDPEILTHTPRLSSIGVAREAVGSLSRRFLSER